MTRKTKAVFLNWISSYLLSVVPICKLIKTQNTQHRSEHGAGERSSRPNVYVYVGQSNRPSLSGRLLAAFQVRMRVNNSWGAGGELISTQP